VVPIWKQKPRDPRLLQIWSKANAKRSRLLQRKKARQGEKHLPARSCDSRKSAFSVLRDAWSQVRSTSLGDHFPSAYGKHGLPRTPPAYYIRRVGGSSSSMRNRVSAKRNTNLQNFVCMVVRVMYFMTLAWGIQFPMGNSKSFHGLAATSKRARILARDIKTHLKSSIGLKTNEPPKGGCWADRNMTRKNACPPVRRRTEGRPPGGRPLLPPSDNSASESSSPEDNEDDSLLSYWAEKGYHTLLSAGARTRVPPPSRGD